MAESRQWRGGWAAVMEFVSPVQRNPDQSMCNATVSNVASLVNEWLLSSFPNIVK